MSAALGGSVDLESTPGSDLDVLLGLLDLEQTDENVFVGHHPEKVWSRTFGGQLVAQGIVAAGRTAGDRPLHVVNAHFVRGGDVKQPIEYHVDRHRDGLFYDRRFKLESSVSCSKYWRQRF